MDAVTAHFRPILTDATLPVMDRYIKGRRVSRINAVSARTLLTGIFADAGLKAEVVGQRYRARVIVELSPGTVLRLYVRYRDLSDGARMQETVKAVLDLKDAIARLGYGTAIRKG